MANIDNILFYREIVTLNKVGDEVPGDFSRTAIVSDWAIKANTQEYCERRA